MEGREGEGLGGRDSARGGDERRKGGSEIARVQERERGTT